MKRNALISGFAGSIVLTAIHEALRLTINDAPRMDKMGEEALSKMITAAGENAPSEDQLYLPTLTGDIIGNALFYSLVGFKPKYAMVTGAVLGTAAGIGAIMLPDKMNLTESYSNRTRKTQLLTFGIYLIGGIVAGACHRLLEKRSNEK